MDGIQVFLKSIYDLVSMICFWTGMHLNYLIVIANPISFSWWSGSFVAGGCMWRQYLHASSFDMGGQLEALRYYWVYAQIVCCCYSTIYPWKLRVMLPPENNNYTAWYPSCSNRRIQNNWRQDVLQRCGTTSLTSFEKRTLLVTGSVHFHHNFFWDGFVVISWILIFIMPSLPNSFLWNFLHLMYHHDAIHQLGFPNGWIQPQWQSSSHEKFGYRLERTADIFQNPVMFFSSEHGVFQQ
jgi:hypothetical protein